MKAFPTNGLSPASQAFAIVPGDAVISPVPRALYVGTAGNITLRAVDSGVDVLFKNVPAGAILDVQALYVRSGAGTTAADIVGLL